LVFAGCSRVETIPTEKPSGKWPNTAAYVHYSKGLLLSKNGEAEEALTEFQEAAKCDPYSATVYLGLAEANLVLGKTEDAVRAYEKALSLDPELEEALIPLTDLYADLEKHFAESNDTGKGTAFFEESVKTVPNRKLSTQLHYYLGILCSTENRIEEAVKHFRIVVDSGLNDPGILSHALYYLAASSVEKKDFNSAIEHLEKALGTGLENREFLSHLHYYLGVAYDQTGKFEKAEEHLKKVLELNPKYDDALNYLSYSYADRGINLDQALELIKRALEISSDNGAYIDTLGWIYFKQGKFEDAVQQLKRAAELSERSKDNLVIFEHLGDALSACKNFKEAIDAYEQSLKIGPDEKDSVRIEQKIEEAKKKAEPSK